MIKWRNTYEIIYECSRTRSNFIFIFFFLLGTIKFSDILPRRTRVKDKNTRSSVSQSVSYNVLHVCAWNKDWPLNFGAMDLTGVLGTDLRPKYYPEFVSSNPSERKREIGFWKNRKRVVPSRSLGGHINVCKCLWQEIPCAAVILLRTAWDSMCRHI